MFIILCRINLSSLLSKWFRASYHISYLVTYLHILWHDSEKRCINCTFVMKVWGSHNFAQEKSPNNDSSSLSKWFCACYRISYFVTSCQFYDIVPWSVVSIFIQSNNHICDATLKKALVFFQPLDFFCGRKGLKSRHLTTEADPGLV